MKQIGTARLGADAEIKHLENGDSVAKLSFAYQYKKRELTQWIRASLWGKRAESLLPYLKKGSAWELTLSEVHIETYQTKSGEMRAELVAKIDDIDFPLSSKSETAAESSPTIELKSKAVDDIPF